MCKSLLIIAVLCGAGLTQEAQAGHGHNHGHNHHNHGTRWGASYGRGWGGGGYVTPGYGGYGGYGGGYGGYGGVYHNTGHYDYHPTTVVPHRGHYHVVPEHYHYHNTGHYHY